MKSRFTKVELLQYMRRWECVNEAEIQELRKSTVSQKLQKLATLMASGKVFNVGRETLNAEEHEVRKRWNLLREAYNASK